MAWLNNFFSGIWHIISHITVVDFVDILCVGIIFYFIYKFIRDRRAGKLALGVVFIIVFLIISDLIEMHTMQYIFQNVLQVGVITLVIVFQPELRSFLEKMGGQSIQSLKSIGEMKGADSALVMINEVANAVADMSQSKTGALIVFERSTKLGDLILTGTVINAQPSAFLIRNIFFKNSPLHDGALIIRDGRLYAASCLLPLTGKSDVLKDLGTRHRAAIGMSENSDAVIIVVSEETGVVSVAVDGKLTREYNSATLKTELKRLLIRQQNAAIAQPKKLMKKLRSKSGGAKKS